MSNGSRFALELCLKQTLTQLFGFALIHRLNLCSINELGTVPVQSWIPFQKHYGYGLRSNESGTGSVADPGSGSGMVKKSGSGIQDEHPRSFFREVKKKFSGFQMLKFFEADSNRGSGMEKLGSGHRNTGIWITISSCLVDTSRYYLYW